MESKKISHTKSTGGIVINKNDKVLVVSQHGTSWSLPKGHLDEEESEIEAATREIYEESGIKKLELVKKVGSYKRYKIAEDGTEDRTELKNITIFLFKTIEEVLKPIDPENPEARWVDKNDVAELLTHPEDKEFYLQAIKKLID